jgi:transposase
LRRVAEIVRANAFDYCKQINEELHVSLRTASRWVAVAKDRGFLDEETSK